MHEVENLARRSTTVIPMIVLGFHENVLQAYLVIVYVYATWLHANLRFDAECVKPLFTTPHFHHGYHGLEHEAIDVNFAIHFPVLDRVFGTYYMPSERWPEACGVESHVVPHGFAAQFLDPLRRH